MVYRMVYRGILKYKGQFSFRKAYALYMTYCRGGEVCGIMGRAEFDPITLFDVEGDQWFSS